MKSLLLLVLAALGLAFSCTGGTPTGAIDGAPGNTDGSQPVETSAGDTRFRVETVASRLEVPWAFAFLPNGSILFTERPGRVRIIENGKLRPEPVFAPTDVEPS